MPASDLTTTLERHWAMFALLDGAHWLSTSEIWERLKAQGFTLTVRQLQSDLECYTAPNSPIPLECDRARKPYRWRLKPAARFQPLPAIDLHAAVTLSLAERLLAPILPSATLEQVAPYFALAKEKLAGQTTPNGKKLAAWPKRIAALRDQPPLTGQAVDPAIVKAVYDALFDENCIHVEYETRWPKVVRGYDLNPIALVYSGSLGYLVCCDLNAAPAQQDHTKTYLLHRMHGVTVLPQKSRVPKGFDLDTYLTEGRISFRHGDTPIQLKARIKADAAPTLEARRLSDDQRLTADGEHVLLEATVWNTYALHTWILGFAEGIEVLEPKALRDEIARKIHEAAAQYGPRPQRSKKR